MPLITCPDCKKEVSDQAASCIHSSRSGSNPSDELQSYWQNDLKLVMDQLREDREGRLEWNGEVKNIDTRTIKIAKVWIKLRNREGQIVQDKEEFLVRNIPLGPGQVKKFTMHINKLASGSLKQKHLYGFKIAYDE